jgi:hypothetical protein
MSWIVANWMTLLTVVLTVVGAASVAVKLIAPLTATKTDDKVAGWLDKVVAVLSKLALNPK